jgi:predicted TIM-barrel fold metal-dependent hydrolase
MHRREFLAASGATALGNSATMTPIIDTHIHLFDVNRPKGVPWPPKDDAVRYKSALPARYVALTQKFNVVGAIEVECSPWPEDNDWVLEVSKPAPIMVGLIGNLPPDRPDFRKELDRLRKNPLFLGLRYGNLWGNDLSVAITKREFVAGLKDLAAAQLVLDSANPDLKLLGALREASAMVPDLRIVIDHLPGMADFAGASESKIREEHLRDLAGNPRIFVKGSAVLKHPADRRKEKLDELWERFGEDRMIFGSDWPNSDGVGTYEEVLRVVYDYAHTRGASTAEKYFHKNSLAAYRWKPRTPEQRKLT